MQLLLAVYKYCNSHGLDINRLIFVFVCWYHHHHRRRPYQHHHRQRWCKWIWRPSKLSNCTRCISKSMQFSTLLFWFRGKWMRSNENSSDKKHLLTTIHNSTQSKQLNAIKSPRTKCKRPKIFDKNCSVLIYFYDDSIFGFWSCVSCRGGGGGIQNQHAIEKEIKSKTVWKKGRKTKIIVLLVSWFYVV